MNENNKNPNPKIKPPQKPFAFYAAIALLIMMGIYMIIVPRVTTGAASEVGYSQFLSMLDEGKVSEVAISNTDSKITFKVVDEERASGYALYFTGIFDDPTLVDRLNQARTATGEKIIFSSEIPQRMGMLSSILFSIVPMILMLVVLYVVFRSMSKRMGGDTMSFGKSSAKMYVQSQTGITFGDVAGQDEAKDALTEIVDFLHSPDKYNSVGAKMPKGALLVGPPGTGKTLLAKAVAGEAGVPFFSIAGSEFVEMFVGRGAARVRDLFKQAKEKAPCIVFIDEIDTIGKKRDSSGMSGGNDEREQTLNQLLSEMDGFDGSKGVIILAATNRPETLDAALLRPGRFDRRIPVELPDLAGREAILRVHAKKIMIDDGIDYGIIARMTSGASGADLANIVNESAIRAVKHKRRMVLQEDLVESVETVIAGQQRKNKVINPKEKRIVAYHEIGHALVAAKLDNKAPVTKITIIPRTSGALGYTMQVDEEESNLLTIEDAHNRIAVLTGGRSAEEVVFETYTSGASNDIEKATKLARAMVTRYGMSKEFDMMALETGGSMYLGGDGQLACGEKTAATIDTEVLTIIKTNHERARKILEENKEKLHELSAFLLEKETIMGEEFMRILNGESAEEEKTQDKQEEAPAEEKAEKESPKNKTAQKEEKQAEEKTEGEKAKGEDTEKKA